MFCFLAISISSKYQSFSRFVFFDFIKSIEPNENKNINESQEKKGENGYEIEFQQHKAAIEIGRAHGHFQIKFIRILKKAYCIRYRTM